MKRPTYKRMASALAAGSLLLTGAVPGAPGDILFGTEFNTPGDFEGWTDPLSRMKDFGWDGVTVTGEEAVIGGVLRAKVTQGAEPNSNDAQLFNNTTISVDADLAGALVMRIRQSSDNGATWGAAGALSGFLSVLSGSVINQAANITQVADETVAGDGWTIVSFNLESVVAKPITNIRVDPTNTLDVSFEIDYLRILETNNPRPTVEIDPAGAIPGAFNLIKEWDNAAQLADLAMNNFTDVAIGPCSTGGGADCVSGTSTGDAQVQSPGGLGIPAAPDGILIVEIGVVPSTSTGVGAAAGDFFWSDAGGGFGGTRRVLVPQFTTEQVDGNLHVIRITMDSYVQTSLNQFRYDPFTGAVASPLDAEVDYIRVYSNAALPPLLNWDNDIVTAGAQGGAGTWDTTNNFFYDSANMVNVAWPDSPGGDDNAVFGATAGTVTIDAGGITAHSLKFETDGYVIDGGDLTLDGSVTAPFFDVDGGSVSAEISVDIVGDDDNARKIGTGTLTLSGTTTANSFTVAGGTLTIPAGKSLTTLGANPTENNYALKTTGSAILNINGIVDASSGDFGGFSGDANFVVNLNAGGELSTLNALAGWNANATYNFNGGTSFINGQLRHQDGGAGVINVLDGTHEVTGLLGANNNGGGGSTVITISGGTITTGEVGFNVGTTAAAPLGANTMTVNLDGGVLETNRVYLNRGPATSPGDNTLNLVLNGGTLRATADGAASSLIDGSLGIAGLGTVAFNVTVGPNGAVIDTNGMNKSIGQPVLGSDGGDLTKLGAGNLYLDAANDYNGETLITAGNLGGSGETYGPVTVSAGAGLACRVTDPANPSTGLLIIGDITLPDPLVISVDSAGTVPFPETSATGIVVIEADTINGFNAATVAIDTGSFTGLGTWTARQDGNQIVLDYTAGSSPFASFMQLAFPGETDLAIIGPDADPDQDGVANIEEFGYGGDPDDATDSGPGGSGVNDVDGTDYLTITVAVRTGASFTGGGGALTATRDGVVYTITGSADLVTFDSLVSEVTPAITAGLPTAPAGYEYRSFRLNPDTAAGVGFLRASAAAE